MGRRSPKRSTDPPRGVRNLRAGGRRSPKRSTDPPRGVRSLKEVKDQGVAQIIQRRPRSHMAVEAQRGAQTRQGQTEARKAEAQGGIEVPGRQKPK